MRAAIIPDFPRPGLLELVAGTLKAPRGASTPQSEHVTGRSYPAIGRKSGNRPRGGQSYRNDSDEAIALEAVRRSTLSGDAEDFRVTLTSGHGGDWTCLWRDRRLRLCQQRLPIESPANLYKGIESR
jgi:hypothetical protein